MPHANEVLEDTDGLSIGSIRAVHRRIGRVIDFGIPALLLFMLASIAFCSKADQEQSSSSDPLYSSGCVRIPFSERSGQPSLKNKLVPGQVVWTTSGVSLAQDDFMVVDIFRWNERRLTAIGKSGVLSPHVDVLRKQSKRYGFLDAKYIHALPGNEGYAILDDGFSPAEGRLPARVLFFDKSHEYIAEILIEGRAVPGSSESLLALWRIAPLGNTGVIGFADFETFSTFVYLDIDGTVEIIDKETRIPDHVRQLFLKDFSYITSIGDTGYALIFDQEPWLARLDRETGITRLLDFPGDFRSSPKLERNPAWSTSRALRMKMAPWQHLKWSEEVQNSRMPAGVFSWDNRLFLLAKEKMSPLGQTPWWILEVDAQVGTEAARFRIPTHAAHVNLISGDSFGVMEKGPVELLGDGPGQVHFRETESMVTFPADWLNQDNTHYGLEKSLLCRYSSVDS